MPADEPRQTSPKAVDNTVVSALRATLVFRREAGTWKIAHRHADPITADRQPGSLIDS
jgi:ketosteroid isomerase-like protein